MTIASLLGTELAKGIADLAREAAVPSIPPATADVNSLTKTVAAIKTLLDTREGTSGSVLDAHVTLRDLMNSGAMQFNINGTRYGSAPTDSPGSFNGVPYYVDPRPVYTAIPAVTNFAVAGALSNVIVTWSLVDFQNFSYTEVWRATTNAIGSATRIGISESLIYVDGSAALGTLYYYWARAVGVATDGTTLVGPYNAVGGTSGGRLFVGSTDLSALAVTADKLSQGTYPNINLIANGSAEDGLVCWIKTAHSSAGSTFSNSTSYKSGGKQSFVVTKVNVTDSVSIISQSIPVIPGETYAVKFSRFGSSSSAAGFYLQALGLTSKPTTGYISSTGDGGDTNTSFQTILADVALPGGWTPWEGTYVVPAGVYWVSFVFTLYSSSTPALDFYLDDFSVGRQITAAFLAAGSIAVGTAAIANGAIVNAMIGTAAIDDAKIANLSAAKITAGTLDAARIAAGSLDANKITAGTITADRMLANVMQSDNVLTRGLTVRDGSGNIILASGSAIDWTKLSSANANLLGLGYVGALDATVGQSLVPPVERWTLGGQTIVVPSPTVVGGTALQLVAGGGYPISPSYFPIDITKSYRIRYWARPTATTDGLLYSVLHQYTDNVGTSGPVNGGRSPYRPASGITRAQHNTAFGGSDVWGLYSAVYTPADWQTGVKYVRPEFLDNCTGTAGWWQIQGFTVEEISAYDAGFVVVSGTEIRGGTITKTIGGTETTWDASARTSAKFIGGAYVTGIVNKATDYWMLGLNDSDTTASFTDINYAVYIAGGAFYVYEEGSSVYSGADTIVAGDVLGVKFDGSYVSYTLNGVEKYGHATTNANALFVDCSIFGAGGSIKNIEYGAYGNPSAIQPSNPITSGNATTYIASAAIGAAQIGSLNADVITAGSIRGRSIQAGTFMTRGTYLTAVPAGGAGTVQVSNTADFAASGWATVYDTVIDRNLFSYSSKDATHFYGCSGVGGGHTLGAAVVPRAQAMTIDTLVNEMRYNADRGDGSIDELIQLGRGSGDLFIAQFGSANSQYIALNVNAKISGTGANTAINANGLTGISANGNTNGYGGDFYGLSSGTGIRAGSASGYGMSITGNATRAPIHMGVLNGRPSSALNGDIAIINTGGGSVDARTTNPIPMYYTTEAGLGGPNWLRFDNLGVWTG